MYTHMRSVIELFAFATDLLATTEIALNIILKRAKLNAIGGQKPSPPPPTPNLPTKQKHIETRHLEKHA